MLEHIIWFTIWAFVFGAVIGSFLNVVILRYEAGKPLTGRSQCPKCKRTLTWRELVPVLSYIAQKGKCKECNERISYQYPLVEFATGILFTLVFLKNITVLSSTYTLAPIPQAQFLLELCVWSLLVVITVYDFRTKLIPNLFSYSFAALALCLVALNVVSSDFPISYLLTPTSPLFAGPLLFLPFWALWKLSDGKWMGLGDGKLALGIGWFLGLEYGGSAILVSFWMGAAVSLAIMAYQHIRSRLSTFNLDSRTSNLSLKSEVPFGPFMILGTLFVYLFQWSILSLIY